MRIALSEEHALAIESQAEQGYPDEICGLLLGRLDQERLEFDIDEITLLVNRRLEAARNRFLIDPDDYRETEREAARRGLDIVGVYHSHPDAPARPSDYDRDHAWPFSAYLIASTVDRKVVDMTGWLLNEDRTAFVPLKIDRTSSNGVHHA